MGNLKLSVFFKIKDAWLYISLFWLTQCQPVSKLGRSGGLWGVYWVRVCQVEKHANVYAYK